jgi:hypothetical protein
MLEITINLRQKIFELVFIKFLFKVKSQYIMVHNIKRLQSHIFLPRRIFLLMVSANHQKFNNDRMKGRYQNQATRAMENL